MIVKNNNMSKVKISTDKGDMIAELYDNETPITVNNFLKLIGEKFYDGLNFHRVIPGFVAQGGCPNKRGDGGPGYTIQCEVSAPKQFHDQGILSMAHAGRNTGGSQFFICHSRQGTQHLDGNHTCFGKVIEGVDIITQIQQGTNINSITVVE
jgi:peptidyl-prolyl cis-trans isomerase B (cyclophilin B)